MNQSNILPKQIISAKRFYNFIHQRFRAVHFLIFLLFAVFVIFNSPVNAQSPVDGAFTGLVYGENKTPISNATVTFTNKETLVPFYTQTDENGRYTKKTLPPGEYIVEVSAKNYLPPEKLQTILYATVEITVLPNFVLKSENSVAAIPINTPDPSVKVTPTPTAAPSEPNERGLIFEPRRGAVFTNKEVMNLPLGSSTFVRSFDELAFLVPGVAPPPQAIGNSVGPGVGSGVGTSGQFSVNGLRSRANNFMVDGSDNNDEDIGVRRQGFFSLIPQPIESIQEFRIITLLAPAQFGRNLGAQVNALSKSGGNDFHGNLYAFFNSERLNARNNFDFVGENKRNQNLQGQRRNGTFADVFIGSDSLPINRVVVENTAGDKDSLTFLEGGATLGGPIVRKKMFFFVSAEGQLLNASKETHFAVPTVEQRGFLGTGAEGIEIGQSISFPTTIIGDYILGLFPFPNDPNGLYGRNTYTRVLPADARGRVISGKYDYNFNVAGKQQVLNARYNFTDDWRDLQQVGGAVFSSIRPLTRTDNFSTFLNGQLRDNLSNVLRFSWGRTRLKFNENKYTENYLRPTSRKFTNPDDVRFLLNGLGLVNLTLPGDPIRYDIDPDNLLTENLLGPVGQVNISGFSPLGVDVFNFPQNRVNNTYQIADTMFLTTQDHNIAFGTDIRRTLLASDLSRNARLSIASGGGFRGIGYTTATGRIPACTPALRSSNSLCIPEFISPIDLIAAGSPTGIFQSLVLPGTDAKIKLSYNQLNFFAQDDFRVSSKLTISYGLRYELNTVPKEADRKIENSFQAVLPSAVMGLSRFIEGRNQIYDLDHNNLAPRIGFAYAPKPSTVIRGGYGIYYDQILGAVVSQSRNVFPAFSTLNLGGSTSSFIGSNSPYNITFCPTNIPDCTSNQRLPLIQPGTLNTLNPAVTQQQLFNFLAGFPNAFGATIPRKVLDIPLSHQYSFGIDHELFPNMMLSVAYVGTIGRNLLRFTTPNLGRNNILSINGLSLAGNVPTFTTNSASPAVSAGLGRPVSNIGPIDQFETTGRSRYDSLQFQLRGRLERDFQYQVSYTLANAKDDVSDVFDIAGASALPQNSVSFAGEYAPANFDIRHRVTYSFIYDLPKLNNRSKLLQYILGGWQIAGTGKFNTGQPFTVNTIFDVNQDGNPTDRLNNTQFIVETGSRHQPLMLIKTDPASLASMLAPIGKDGSVPRNSFRAGSVLELNMSFNKHFSITDRQNLLLRFDVFNFINRANFGIPVRFLEAPNFGQAVETITPGRRIQIALKYIF